MTSRLKGKIEGNIDVKLVQKTVLARDEDDRVWKESLGTLEEDGEEDWE